MKVLMVAHFTQEPNGGGNNRFKYLAELLCEKDDIELEVVTSDFSHELKKRRVAVSADKYKFTMIPEPGYPKNVCIQRFYSHFMLGRNMKEYFKGIEKPDVIYCAVPSLDVALVTGRYAKKYKIRFIIDVQDLWPEAFQMVLKQKFLGGVLFSPFHAIANTIYKMADEVVAVSQTYVDRAVTVNRNVTTGTVVFLGTKLSDFDRIAEESTVPEKNSEIVVAYIGTLGHSYNLMIAIDALKEVSQQVNIKFLVMGEGPLREKFELHAKKKDINVEFTGMLPYTEMVQRLVQCDIAINPITKGAAQSIINKVGDYAAASLPVVNTQENEEYRDLIAEYQAGINCDNEDVNGLAKAFLRLCQDPQLREAMGKNNRRLAEEKFDRESTYGEIVDMITDTQ